VLEQVESRGRQPIGSDEINFSEIGYFPILMSSLIGLISAIVGTGGECRKQFYNTLIDYNVLHTSQLLGGLLMSALLLYLGLSPNAVSATSATTGVLVAISIVLQHLNKFPVEYSFWLLFLGILGGSSGRYIALHMVQNYNRQSFITFCLVGFCCLAILLLVVQAAVAEDIFSFNSFCDTDS
jgi:uncharacterized membrane protein YfcA